jgi:hypothetical protein
MGGFPIPRPPLDLMSDLSLFWGENKKYFSTVPHFTLKISSHGFAIAVGIHYLDTNS